MLERKWCAISLLEWWREPEEDLVNFLNWLHLDIESFLVYSNIDVRTAVLFISCNLTNEMWQQTQPKQLKQK